MLEVLEKHARAVRPRHGATAVFGVVAAVALTGCYQRVVSATGPGTEGYTIHEPASDDVMFKRFDRWIMGEPEPAKHRRR